ncbi:hypothetical protein Bca52824_019571 [Brassica carinata]|uniref:Uncharacterized protein n=1 Tax=Brassica carinata TaxID=52824 RepID=A0A8X8AXI7_BRACI|nr:hypothetical protein Bca52824_019571 [Brassica carinata]
MLVWSWSYLNIYTIRAWNLSTHLLEVDLVRAPPYLCRSPLRSDCKHHDFISQLLISPMLNPPQKQIVKTIENTREADETVCRPDDEEFFSDIDAEEFNLVLRREVTPKVLITTCHFNSTNLPLSHNTLSKRNMQNIKKRNM